MDQMKVFLALLKKHHFWVLSMVVVIASLVSWSVSSGKLVEKFSTNKGQIDSAANGLKSVLGGEYTPNPRFVSAVEVEHEGLKSNVFTAWRELYEKQVSKFVWPADMPDLANYPPEDEIPRERRAYYNETVVREEWEALLDEVPVRRVEEDEEKEGEEEGEVNSPRTVGIVEWSESQRRSIIDRYYTKGIPSSLSVRLAQEDLWVFKTLVDLVNEMNQVAIAQMKLGTHDPLLATIKRIDTLDLAQWAIIAAQSDPTSLVASSGQEGGSGGGMQSGGAGGMQSGGAGGMQSGGAGGMQSGGAGGMQSGGAGGMQSGGAGGMQSGGAGGMQSGGAGGMQSGGAGGMQSGGAAG
ncbi:MAG TPA: hypothetical protein VMV69_25205, partial [Pirellulales bacterium]|nr:hypothetical protein [Pirellulales bacterium]